MRSVSLTSIKPGLQDFMPDLHTIAIIFTIFFTSGIVKGLVGVGLQTIALALLIAYGGLHEAMALLLAPAFVTNVYQASSGGDLRPLLKRIWQFLLAATLTVWIGGLALTRIHVENLTALLGVILTVYSVAGLTRPHFVIPPQHEKWLGRLMGAMTGILTGMTGSFVVPGVMYLQSIGLSRDDLIRAMGMLFTLLTVALTATLGGANILTAHLGLMSALAVIPTLLGVYIGGRMRRRISEATFRKVFYAALLLLGLYIVLRSVTS